MAGRRSSEWQLGLSFDADRHEAVVVPVEIPGQDAPPIDDAPPAAAASDPSPAPTTTRVIVADADEQVPDAGVSADDGDDAKPPYRIPLMDEIRALPWNGLNVVSTFSGCGGSCLGYKMAGYRVLWANEFVPSAQETYRANHEGTHLDASDIRLVTAAKIREVIGDVEIDVLEGSPPCASFSTAGKTSKGWGQVRKYSDLAQRTDDLFEQYIRLVDELRPRAFVAENVSGMVKGVAVGFFREYLAKMERLPYNVEARLLDAQWLGVPQRRVRLIFVGVRKDVGRPAWPRRLGYRYSVRDAIPWIAEGARVSERVGGERSSRSAEREAPTITANGIGAQSNRGARDSGMLIEPSQHVVGIGTKSGVESLDEPSPTVLTHGRPHTESELSVVVEVLGGFAEKDADGVKQPTRISVDEPMETIRSETHGFDGDVRLPCVETRVVPGDRGSRRRRDEGKPFDLDEPMSTVVADGARNTDRAQFFVEQRVVHDTKRDGVAARDVTDEPCPTITVGSDHIDGGGARQQFAVETRIVGGNSAIGAQKGANVSLDEPMPTVLAGGHGPHGLRDRTDQFIIERSVEPESALGNAVGAEWDKLKPGEQSDRYMSLILPTEHEPCPTVTALGGTSAASVAHPYERRKFTIAELRRICGFPDDFVLKGSYAQQWERLGRAVPPPMMAAVARALVPVLRKGGGDGTT